MRLGKRSNAHRVRHAPNWKIPPRLTRDDEGFKNLEGKPERQKIESFDIAEFVSHAARKAASFVRSRRIPGAISLLRDSPEVLEDCASSALIAWYEIEESKRPSALIEVQLVLFKAALAHLTREANLAHRSIRPDNFEGGWEAAYTADVYGKGVSVPQETYILAIQAQNIIGQLPRDLQIMALRMADGCSLPEAAVELGMDLYAAMHLQQEVRKVARHICDFGAAENMFSDLRATLALPSKQRHSNQGE